MGCIELQFALFNLESNTNLYRIIQIQELTFCIYNSLGKLEHTMKQNIVEINTVLGKTIIKNADV